MSDVIDFPALRQATVIQAGEAVGPTPAEQMEIIGLSARLALAETVYRRDIMPDAVRAEARRLACDLLEEREAQLSGLSERYGRAVTEDMLMMQYAALAHAAARAIELHFGGE
jgi:hypothetical protein